jgi:hypothetical protein
VVAVELVLEQRGVDQLARQQTPHLLDAARFVGGRPSPRLSPVLLDGVGEQALEGRRLGGHRGAQDGQAAGRQRPCLVEHELIEPQVCRHVAAHRGVERDAVARRVPRLDEHRDRRRAGALLAHRQHLDPVPDPFVDRVGEGVEVFDVADGVVPFHPVQALEDRPRYLRRARLQALGQQGATVTNPPRPTIE